MTRLVFVNAFRLQVNFPEMFSCVALLAFLPFLLAAVDGESSAYFNLSGQLKKIGS